MNEHGDGIHRRPEMLMLRWLNAASKEMTFKYRRDERFLFRAGHELCAVLNWDCSCRQRGGGNLLPPENFAACRRTGMAFDQRRKTGFFIVDAIIGMVVAFIFFSAAFAMYEGALRLRLSSDERTIAVMKLEDEAANTNEERSLPLSDDAPAL